MDLESYPKFLCSLLNLRSMGDARDNEAYEEELLDYEEEDEKVPDSGNKVNGEAVKKWVLWFPRSVSWDSGCLNLGFS